MQGHVHKRVTKTKSGKETTNWYVVIDIGRDESGARKQKWHGAYRTRREAETAKAKMVNDFNGGAYVAPGQLTFAEFVNEQWLTSIKTRVKPSTFHSYRRNLALHILPRLGHLKLQQITAKLLNDLYAALAESGNNRNEGGLHPKTIRNLHTTIHKAMNDAIDLQLIGTNPASRAKPPRAKGASHHEMKSWDANDVRAFLETVSNHRLYAAWHLAITTGMRRGELAGLRWSDIDFARKSLAVRHTLVSVSYELSESTPKSHKARTVDLDQTTCEVLQTHRAKQQADKATWGKDYSNLDYVFARESGLPTHPDQLTQAFDRLLTKTSLPRIRLHDLRHTHATLALRAGAPVKVISERLGHESPAFTLKQYAHVMPGMQAEAAQMVADMISSSLPR